MTQHRQIKIVDVNEFGVLFTQVPRISMNMEAPQIKAELQLAHNKLDEAMTNWKISVYEELNSENPLTEKEKEFYINKGRQWGQSISTAIMARDKHDR